MRPQPSSKQTLVGIPHRRVRQHDPRLFFDKGHRRRSPLFIEDVLDRLASRRLHFNLVRPGCLHCRRGQFSLPADSCKAVNGNVTDVVDQLLGRVWVIGKVKQGRCLIDEGR